MSMYTHACIKCGTKYQDSDPDPYYCDSCKEEKRKLAEEVDKKLKGRISKKQSSLLEEYDNAPKVRGFVHVRF